MASLTAMVSYVESMGDDLRFQLEIPLSNRYVTAGNHKMIFLVKGPIVLVAVAKTREPVSQYLST
jgi:hypothetical protein